MEHTRFIGLDVHKERISIAVAESGRSGAVEYLGEISNDPVAIGKLCDRLGRPDKTLAFCYEAGKLTMNTIAARASLVATCQRLVRTFEAVAQLTERNGIVGNLTEVFHRPRASALRHRNRYPFFVNIQADKSGMFHKARLLCMRLCAGQPA